MALGVGGSTIEVELNNLSNMTTDVIAISEAEYRSRINKAQQLMREQGVCALYLDAGTNLHYFTGLKWYKSERMVGAILPVEGDLEFIAPHFEEGSLRDNMLIQGNYNGWHEDESPYQLFANVLTKIGFIHSHFPIFSTNILFRT